MKTHRRDKGRLAGQPKCPTCGTVLDGFTGITNEKAVPKDGDVSVCAYCAQPLEARGSGWIRLEGASLAEALSDKRFKVAMDMVQAFKKERQS